MTYEETIELEENIKIKNKANEIYANFLKNIKLGVSQYKGAGRFVLWADSHNATYVTLKDDVFWLNCRFLHETYDMEITPSSIFSKLKSKSRVVEHLESIVPK